MKKSLDTVLVFRYDSKREELLRYRAGILGISASSLYRKILDQYVSRISISK